jgi:hypothetical protein
MRGREPSLKASKLSISESATSAISPLRPMASGQYQMPEPVEAGADR